LAAFDHFVDRRLAAFGPFEDAMLADDGLCLSPEALLTRQEAMRR